MSEFVGKTKNDIKAMIEEEFGSDIAAASTGRGLGTTDAGLLYFDTTEKKVKVWNGSKWEIASGTVAGGSTTVVAGGGGGLLPPGGSADGNNEGSGSTAGGFVAGPGGRNSSGCGPAPGLVNQRDYTYRSPSSDQSQYYIDLRYYEPDAVNREPLEQGLGVGYRWTIPEGNLGTFETGLFYEDALTMPEYWKFSTGLQPSVYQALREEYIAKYKLEFIISPGGSNEASPAYFPSRPLINFLKEKGIAPFEGEEFTSAHGDTYTWRNGWVLTAPFVRTTLPGPPPPLCY